MSYEGMWLHNDVVVEAALVDMSIAFVAGMRRSDTLQWHQ